MGAGTPASSPGVALPLMASVTFFAWVVVVERDVMGEREEKKEGGR